MNGKPKDSPYVVGIDFGTSNSSISVYHKGEAQTISVDGENKIPSVVQFKDGKRDGLVVGKVAKKSILIHPQEVFVSIKRLMKNEDWKSDTGLVEKFTIEDTPLEPVHIAAEILKKLMEEVHSQTGFDLKGTVRRAVICVPANTTDEYRQNVYKAAALAGLGEVDESGHVILNEDDHTQGVQLLEEPTAAAIAYAHELGIFSDEKEQTILIYDLGGGTFDVTILHVDSMDKQPKFTVKATKGVALLGGDDFDKLIMDICVEHFKKESDIDIYDLKSDQAGGTSGKDLKAAQQKLKEEAERVKIEFAGGSQKQEISIVKFLKDGNGKEHDLELEVKKSELVEKLQPLLDQAKECVKDVLTEATLTLDDINRIILVGGSSKADWVVDSIKSLYPAGEEKDPYRAKDVDVIVSQGAAISGAFKPIQDFCPNCEKDVDTPPAEDNPCPHCGFVGGKVISIVSHHLGIELEGGVFGLILEKGLELSDDVSVQMQTRVYGNPENQDTLQIVVWKSQKTIEFEDTNGKRHPKEKSFVNERDVQGNRTFDCIGEFTLKGIPIAPRGTEKIEVAMEINKDNLLKIAAKILGTETVKEMELSVTKV